ncbi:MAG: EVE domain-containing protein [Fimbriimonadaceae bacterium]|nr:EVE domain-containing protein [Chitinophagales bacterium]
MNYWLIKSEPETYSWSELVKKVTDMWNGVRNFAARNHLRSMKKDDICLFYHSGKESAVVGLAKVVKEAYPDPTATEGDWTAVDVKAIKPLKKHVTLQDVKKEKLLADMPLVRIGRLSVQPVTEFQFFKIMDMGETKL